jgi:hypothetical protein
MTDEGRDVAAATLDTDRWPRYGLLLAVVTAAVALQGVIGPGGAGEVVVTALLGGSLILAFRVARLSPAFMWLAGGATVAGLLVAVLRAGHAGGAGEVRLVNALLVALGPPAVAVGVIRNLRSSRAVRVQAVMGVLALYMLLGMLFAFVYGAVDRLGGEPFFADATPATTAKCLYYSFTTLTTVGYGDLTSRSDLGHTLSIFEALTGQIYLVTVVALIVGNLGRRG